MNAALESHDSDTILDHQHAEASRPAGTLHSAAGHLRGGTAQHQEDARTRAAHLRHKMRVAISWGIRVQIQLLAGIDRVQLGASTVAAYNTSVHVASKHMY